MDGMDNEMDPMMKEEEKPKEEMMEEKPMVPKFGGDDSDDEYDSVKRKDKLSPCCCCLCVCENTATENVTCCCCCPITCGIQVIGALTILITFYYISWNFFLILNDQVTWWFPVVTIVLLIPLYIASGLYVNWFIKDTLGSRGKLTGACILVLVSVACVAVWNVIYYVAIYKRDDVFIGYGVSEDKYQKFQKKYYLFKVLLEAAILLAFYGYFMCVIQTYKDLLRTEKEKKEEDMMDEKKD